MLLFLRWQLTLSGYLRGRKDERPSDIRHCPVMKHPLWVNIDTAKQHQAKIRLYIDHKSLLSIISLILISQSEDQVTKKVPYPESTG